MEIMLYMAVITPAIGALYLGWQIYKRDLRGWQHYACLTALVFLISILFLVESGKVESFGLAGNTIKIVDQKLDEIKSLTEENKRLLGRIEGLTEQNKMLAKATVDLVAVATHIRIATEDFEMLGISQRMKTLLQAVGMSDAEIERHLKELKKLDSTQSRPNQ